MFGQGSGQVAWVLVGAASSSLPCVGDCFVWSGNYLANPANVGLGARGISIAASAGAVPSGLDSIKANCECSGLPAAADPLTDISDPCFAASLCG